MGNSGDFADHRRHVHDGATAPCAHAGQYGLNTAHRAVVIDVEKDFTPVCTTELGYVARIKPEFDKRNVKVIGLSVDPVDSHVKWEADIAETQGTPVNFPMIGDSDRKVSDLYGMIHPNANDTLTVRSVFVVGPDKKV
ncbi:MAG: hypothetical protein EBW96_08540, partial [Actinobacteria bacterium]|nr:hypothetical protein [Actinomycetota bacterium]